MSRTNAFDLSVAKFCWNFLAPVVLICVVFLSPIDVTAQKRKVEITGQKALSTFEATPITLKLTDFTIKGTGENQYPTGFTLTVFERNTYRVSGTTVTPAEGFTGTLKVDIRISFNDGTEIIESKKEDIKIEVKEAPANVAPVIIAQVPLQTKVNQSIKIEFGFLTVVDPDNDYPGGFSLLLDDGANYSVANNTITPANNFTGTLIIRTRVNDGKDTSAPFDLKISVAAGAVQPGPDNSAPYFTAFSSNSLQYSLGNDAFFISREITIADKDSEDLLYAEVFFTPEHFIPGKDQLLADPVAAISSVFDSQRGILVLFGKASLGLYESVLRSVRYNFNNDTLPSLRSKKINYRLNDGVNFSEVKSKMITVAEGLILDIPTAFSPNDDDANDRWIIRPKKESDNLTGMIRVFDKQGRLVFETNEIDDYWDGKLNGSPVPADTYYFVITYSQGANLVKHQGVVNLLR